MFLGFATQWLSDILLPSSSLYPLWLPNLWTTFLGIAHKHQDTASLRVDASDHGSHSLFWRIHSFLANNPNQNMSGNDDTLLPPLGDLQCKEPHLAISWNWETMEALVGTPFPQWLKMRFHEDSSDSNPSTSRDFFSSSRAVAWALCMWVLLMTAEPG